MAVNESPPVDWAEAVCDLLIRLEESGTYPLRNSAEGASFVKHGIVIDDNRRDQNICSNTDDPPFNPPSMEV